MKIEMITDQEVNDYNLRQMKEFLNTLTPEQLEQKVRIAFIDCPIQHLWGHEIQEEDIYCHKGDNEDGGCLQDLKDFHGDDFNQDEYRICLPKGAIFFS